MSPPFARPASLVLFVLGSALLGCEVHARSPDEYRDATAQVLAARNDQVRSCYDAIGKGDPLEQGTVSVRFKVEADTGKFVNPQVVGGTAPQPVKDCVLKSLDGAVLTPADKRDGDATFVWVFVPPKPSG